MSIPANQTHASFEGIIDPSWKIGLLVAEWNDDITGPMAHGARRVLEANGLSCIERTVAGSYELPMAAKMLIDYAQCHAVICLGCLIKGDTPHFEFISEAVAHGLMSLSIQSGVPCIFGVITTLNKQQAFDRVGGTHGHKGEEAAIAALKMLALKATL
jgi:6,7-dimethyl-8-ribityllumazine synthase